ncbi:apolipoprotein D and lipocalin family protein [Endobacter medicaginis]|uniref:Outer membrane lipoprotein Blc n=1 Tax=Endobacter medicaginis TaxID=1181271 RepID=A0A839UXU5_9PROT|nr:lipocalin family protein [Endobacter medicaginis]MBB3173193.1 apolipoprotein D and lipocalin family protein [Endobacter medicaginis]MCX5476617.1 lipocalin family protein [Endobacter medicaginis]NVN29909.1 lipocalin family protein [Endobacter medicaginis]
MTRSVRLHRPAPLPAPLIATVAVAATALALGGCALLMRHPVGNPDVPQPRGAVDLARYLGRWYEIARYEQVFERGCDHVTADYTLGTDGRIGIVNGCIEANGRASQARGRAYVVDGSGGAKLKVSFFGPFYVADYWILDHDDAAGWSVVGDPSGRYLWLLSRRAVLTPEEAKALAGRAAALGYDISMLRWTRQD